MSEEVFFLKNAKSKLTRQLNILLDLIEEAEEFRQPWNFTTQIEELEIFLISRKMIVRNLISRIAEKREYISEYYATCNHRISIIKETDKAEIESQFDEYWLEKKGEEILQQAQELEMKLERRVVELDCQEISMQRERSSQQSSLSARQLENPQTSTQLNPANMLQIPIFEGNPSEFANFWELFEELVHKRPFSNIEKLSILLNSCKGDAARSLQMIPRTGEAYERAINQLKNLYEDPRRIKMQMLRQLKATKQCKDDPRALRNNLSDIQAIVSTLEKQGEAINTTNLINTVLETFPKGIQEEMARKEFDSGSVWTMADLLSNLTIAVKRKEHVNSFKENFSEEYRIFHTSSTPIPIIRCTGCGQEHKFQHCNKYESVDQKIYRLKEINACWKCFSCRHPTRLCRKRNCVQCGGSHNLILCRKNTQQAGRLPSRYAFSFRKDVSPFYRRQKTLVYDRFWNQTPRRSTNRSHSQHRTDSRKAVLSKRERPRSRTSSESPRRSSSRVITSEEDSLERQHRVRFKRSPSPQNNPLETVSINLQIGGFENKEKEDYNSNGFAENLVGNNKVRLMIVPIHLRSNQSGEITKSFALLDSASDQSFITNSLVQKLHMKPFKESTIMVNTFGGRAEKRKVKGIRTSLYNSEGERIEMKLLTNEKITPALQLGSILPQDWAFIMENFCEAEATELSQTAQGMIEPEILIGMDYFNEILKLDGNVTRLPSGLLVVPTFFGPVITGSIHRMCAEEQELYKKVINACTCREEKHQLDLSDLWKLSTIGIEDAKSDEEINNQIVEMFYSTVKLENNRIYVRFPWKPNKNQLSSNYNLALSRLHQLSKMKERNPVSWNDYCSIIEEQLEKGFIEEVPNFHRYNDGEVPCYYIPHQAVVKLESATTKLRIVFDASSRMRGELSLNDVIYQGPLLLPNLCGVLLRSRIGAKILIADVEKAFHMIHLQETERNAVRFLWLKDVNRPPERDNLRILRFCRLPFGINASPFLLGISIKYGIETQKLQKSFQNQLSKNLYVDNVLLTDESSESLTKKYQLCKQVFRNISMNLRQFLTNDEICNSLIAPEDRSTSKSIKILGIPWNNKDDSYVVRCKLKNELPLTKRKILQTIHSNFDPLGLIIPLLLPARLFLQSIWKEKYSWDDHLSPGLHREWRTICEETGDFEAHVPRSVTHLAQGNQYELHSFVDASTRSFAAATYLRAIDGGGGTRCSLLIARQRLAPIDHKKKPLTIPRLELLALVIGIRLTDFVLEELQLNILAIHVYSDSQVVLHWIQSPDKNGVFVDNRCNEIRNKLQAWAQKGISCRLFYTSVGRRLRRRPTLDR